MLTFKTSFYLHCIQNRNLVSILFNYTVPSAEIMSELTTEKANEEWRIYTDRRKALVTYLKILFRHSLEWKERNHDGSKPEGYWNCVSSVRKTGLSPLHLCTRDYVPPIS
jgi:hypothetical protein